MKTIQIEIPEGYEAKWDDGVLIIVEEQEQPNVKFKFDIGDKVEYNSFPNVPYTIIKCHIDEKTNTPYYTLTDGKHETTGVEKYLKPYKPKDITERIKTAEDALKWCGENGRKDLIKQYVDGLKAFENSPDIIAYLKLRIITCALNEGEIENCIYSPYWQNGTVDYITANSNDSELILTMPSSLLFRDHKLAEYAGTQFHDIYMDFCYKRKE